MPYDAPLSSALINVNARAERWCEAERLLSLPPEWSIFRAGDLAWLHPMPSLDWYRSEYNRSYYSDGDDSAYTGESTRDLRLGYFAKRIDRISHHLGGLPKSSLDVGAGIGTFVFAAQQAGIKAEGIDLSERACARARTLYGVTIHPGDLLDSNLPLKERYELVTMNHVLEHLVTPTHYLRRVRELLTPDGLLVFEIPQQFINPIDLIYRGIGHRRPFGPASLHHPYFYTVSSVRRLMKVTGFRIERLCTWLPGQIFHSRKRHITVPLQALLWLADRVASRGHIIEVFARPA